MNIRLLLVAATFTAGFMSVNAQNYKPCGTDEARKKMVEKFPQIEQIEAQEELDLQSAKVTSTAGTVYTVPIVFHVLHNYGSENISDAQVIDAVRIINEDFRKLNTDASQIDPDFTSAAPADAEIQFKLARKDAYGACTNGINRVATSATFNGDDNAKDLVDHNQWPRSRYLNIYVVANIMSGAAGYAYLPATASFDPNADGIMILHNYVGGLGTSNYNSGRALTHEIGHWINLNHVWGTTNTPGVSCGSSDGVSDTPVTKGWTTCNLTNNKVCNASIVENVENFMEYSYCSKMFTPGQVTRMRTSLTSATAQRSSLWTTTNLSNTGVSLPDVLCNTQFSSSKLFLCEGDNATFSETSWNGQPGSWNWTFNGGSPSSSSDSMPTITYPTAGKHDVSLTVSNGSGSPSTTKSNYINVSSLTADNQGTSYTEGFEGGQTVLDNDWIVNNVDGSGVTWKATTSAKYGGSYSMWVNNWSEDSTDIEEIVSPSMNLATMNSPKLYYKIAYARYNSSDNDNLRIYVSKDCGKTWYQRQSKSGAQLISVANPVTSAFIPTNTSQWRADSVSIPLSYATSNVRIKFYWKCGYGNNVYIDDINVHGLSTGINEDIASKVAFTVMPNPVESNTEFSFDLTTASSVNLSLYDMLGKSAGTVVDNNALSSGSHRYTLDCSRYTPGIYFAKLTIDKQQFVQKIVVK